MADGTDQGTRRSRTGGVRSRLARASTRVFSLRAFLAALGLSLVGALVGGAIPLVGGLGGIAGVFVAGFVLGVLAGERRYLESVIAGAVVAGIGTFLDFLVVSVVGIGVPIVAIGAGSGAIAAVVGHYFGRDLRAGLAREL